MVERYTLSSTTEDLVDSLKIEPTLAYKPIYNCGPTLLLPVVTHEHPGGFSFFYWGLPPEMTKSKPVSKKLINAELGQFEHRTSYRKALLGRRCLIPADGIYLWRKVSQKGRIPYRFVFNEQRPFYIAGIWEEFDSTDSSDIHTFSMITIPSNSQISSFSEMMPAIIKNSRIAEWMDPQSAENTLLDIIKDTPDEDFGSYPVSSRVNNLSFNEPELIEPSKPMDQFGNYSLFD